MPTQFHRDGTCRDCGTTIPYLEVFPGPRCLSCWAVSPDSIRLSHGGQPARRITRPGGTMLKSLHKPGDRLPNGSTVVIIATDHTGDAYVLANNGHEFVTWAYDPSTGHTGSGHYPAPQSLTLAALDAAVADLRERVGDPRPAPAPGIDADDLFVNVFGSAFETMPWYRDVIPQRPGATIDEPGPVRVTIEHERDRPVSLTITPQSLVKGLERAMASGQHCFGIPLTPGMDWDADAADVLIQYMVLGTVTYG